MREAIRLSLENVQSGKGGPFGAVIVKNGEMIATGVNEVTGTNDPTAHAEIIAIRNACEKLDSFQLDDCEIYCSCEPCPMCLAAIHWARIEKIYYANTQEDARHIGFDDHAIYEELTKNSRERKIPTAQILPKEGKAAFRTWEEKVDKTPY